MEYQFKEIEKRWQAFWAKNNTFKTEDDCMLGIHSDILPLIL